jgi:hypothetical protein
VKRYGKDGGKASRIVIRYEIFNKPHWLTILAFLTKFCNHHHQQQQQQPQALVSLKKYIPPPFPYFKVNIYLFPHPKTPEKTAGNPNFRLRTRGTPSGVTSLPIALSVMRNGTTVLLV